LHAVSLARTHDAPRRSGTRKRVIAASCQDRQPSARIGGPACGPSAYSELSNGTGIVRPRLTTLSATLVVKRFTLGFSLTKRAISAS
jgi:hypothetical protein